MSSTCAWCWWRSRGSPRGYQLPCTAAETSPILLCSLSVVGAPPGLQMSGTPASSCVSSHLMNVWHHAMDMAETGVFRLVRSPSDCCWAAPEEHIFWNWFPLASQDATTCLHHPSVGEQTQRCAAGIGEDAPYRRTQKDRRSDCHMQFVLFLLVSLPIAFSTAVRCWSARLCCSRNDHRELQQSSSLLVFFCLLNRQDPSLYVAFCIMHSSRVTLILPSGRMAHRPQNLFAQVCVLHFSVFFCKEKDYSNEFTQQFLFGCEFNFIVILACFF